MKPKKTVEKKPAPPACAVLIGRKLEDIALMTAANHGEELTESLAVNARSIGTYLATPRDAHATMRLREQARMLADDATLLVRLIEEIIAEEAA